MSGAPSKVKIGWKEYTIDLEWASPKSLFGECDHVAALIKVDRDLKGPAKIECLLHEILHATWDIWGLAILTSSNNDTEEKVVTCIAHGLTTVLVDNPDLRAYIMSEITKPIDVKGEC